MSKRAEKFFRIPRGRIRKENTKTVISATYSRQKTGFLLAGTVKHRSRIFEIIRIRAIRSAIPVTFVMFLVTAAYFAEAVILCRQCARARCFRFRIKLIRLSLRPFSRMTYIRTLLPGTRIRLSGIMLPPISFRRFLECGMINRNRRSTTVRSATNLRRKCRSMKCESPLACS